MSGTEWKVKDGRPEEGELSEEAMLSHRLTDIMMNVFLLAPDQDTQASVAVSFIMTLLTNHAQPENVWSQIKRVVDVQLPEALAEIARHKH